MERLQILLRPGQAARLRDVARVQGVPVTELVRGAIDQAFPHPRAPQRRASWARFKVGSGSDGALYILSKAKGKIWKVTGARRTQ